MAGDEIDSFLLLTRSRTFTSIRHDLNNLCREAKYVRPLVWPAKTE